MSGNGVFNNVSANGMNVTGILQASQIVTTQPMQVSNLSLTGALNLTDVNAAGDLSVAGSSTLTGAVTAVGAITVNGVSTLTGAVTAAGAVTVNGVSTLNGDVNAKTFAAAAEVSSTRNTDIRASSGIDGDSLAIQGSPAIIGDLSISGNVYVGGNVFTGITASVASVLNSTGLVPTGLYVPDSQDIFYSENTNTKMCYLPIHFESEKNVDVPLFTDSTKTVYVNKNTAATGSKSLLIDYPTANVYQPRVTSISNASINSIYSDIYSNCGVSYGVTTHFSAQPLSEGVTAYTQDEMNSTFSTGIGYYTDRGFPLSTPDYNVNYKNMFVTGIYDVESVSINGTVCTLAVELGYDVSMSVPSNVYLSAVNYNGIGSFQTPTNVFYSSFNPAYKALAVTNSNVFLQPATVPVTTDPATFASAFGTANGKMALYDLTKKEIHIYFDGSSNTYGTGNTTAAFTTGTNVSPITWTEVCEFSHFEGSFAIKKKRAKVTDSNRPFAPANTTEEGAFLIQTSNNLSVTSNVYKNGVQIFNTGSQTTSYGYYSATVARNIVDPNWEDGYSGVIIPKVGFGTDRMDVFSFNQVAPNAAFASNLPYELLDKNPNSELEEYNPIPSYIGSYNSNVIAGYQVFTTNSNLFTSTPESLLAEMTADDLSASSPALAVDIILNHELSHTIHWSTGTIAARDVCDIEGRGTSAEMSYIKNVHPTVIDTFRNAQWSNYINVLSRGAWPVDSRFGATEGNLHLLGSSQGRTFSAVNARYGESMFYNYIINHHDTNQQNERYFYDLLQQKLKEGFIDAGLPSWKQMYGCSIKVSHNALDKCVKTITAAQGSEKSLATVYTDFVVANALLRNNSTIPDKYKTLFPYWAFNKDAPWITKLGEVSPALSPNDSLVWSDSLDGIPIGRTDQWTNLLGPSYSWTIGAGGLQNDTLIPIWPKQGTTARPFSNGPVLSNLGSWANPSTRDAWTYTSNTYVTTPLVHQLEDLASFTYIMPIHSNAAANVYGTSSYVSNVAITVQRGDWVFKVVQFVPDGAQGKFIQSADINVNITDDVLTLPSTWSGGTAQTIDINFSTIATTTTTSTGTVNTSGFQKECHGTDWHGAHVWYFPRLLCINKKNYDYGPYRNVYPRQCIYTGYMTMQATLA